MTAEAEPVTVYDWWDQVPQGRYASRTQLAAADLPRKATGPVRARVWSADWRDHDRQLVDLYDVSESVPTRTTASSLAASERRGAAVRVCADCGGHSQRPLVSRDGRHRCMTCSHIAKLVERQIELREERAGLTAWAAEQLADPGTAVVWVDLVAAERTFSGRSRPPLAARVTAVDAAGDRLLDLLVDLTGPRTEGAPPKAIEPKTAARRLTRALGERTRLLSWDSGTNLHTVLARLQDLGHPAPLPGLLRHNGNGPLELQHTIKVWRGDLDPATGFLRDPWPPGTADRLHLLLQAVAEDDGTGRPGTSGRTLRRGTGISGSPGRFGSYPVQIAVTGPAGAGERLAGVLAATGLLEPRAVHGPVPSREVPGHHLTYLGGSEQLLADAVGGEQ